MLVWWKGKCYTWKGYLLYLQVILSLAGERCRIDPVCQFTHLPALRSMRRRIITSSKACLGYRIWVTGQSWLQSVMLYPKKQKQTTKSDSYHFMFEVPVGLTGQRLQFLTKTLDPGLNLIPELQVDVWGELPHSSLSRRRYSSDKTGLFIPSFCLHPVPLATVLELDYHTFHFLKKKPFSPGSHGAPCFCLLGWNVISFREVFFPPITLMFSIHINCYYWYVY